ncbi:glycosyl transferase [Clostridiaceae bacterium 35-E11]
MPIILFFVSYIITKKLVPMFLALLHEAGSVNKNFRGEEIPVSIGIIFIPVILMNIACLMLWPFEYNQVLSFIFLIGSLGMGLAGLLDDLLGNRNVTGLKGHFKMILKGRLTTGGFKAVFGGFLAFVISVVISNGWINVFMNTLIIALFTNFMNLLDLRPGRALKGFLLSGCVLLFIPVIQVFRDLLFGLIGAVVAYLPYDLKARSMMGDVGSNILGISLGITCASANFPTRVVTLIFLVALHIYTEKYSLTQTIKENKILNFLDEIGR